MKVSSYDVKNRNIYLLKINRENLISLIFSLMIFMIFFTGSNIFKLLTGPVIDIIFLVLIVLLFCCKKTSNVLSRLEVSFVLLYFLFLTFVFISTAESQYSSIIEPIRYLMKAVFLLLILCMVPVNSLNQVPQLYSRILFFIVFISLCCYPLYFFTSDFFSFKIDDRSYHNFLFNWVLQDDGYESTLIRMGDIEIPRFQSMFEEPGSFSFLLIPAIMYYISINKNFIALTLVFSLLLTFSVGSVILFFILSFLMIKVIVRNKKYLTFILSFSGIAIFFVGEFVLRYLLIKFGSAEYSGSGTSLSTRTDLIFSTLDYASNLPIIGFGVNDIDQFNALGSYSRTIYPHLVRGGLFSMIAVLAMMVILFYISMRLRWNSSNNIFYCSLLLMILFMGTQRSSFIDSYFTIFYIGLSLRYFISRQKVLIK